MDDFLDFVKFMAGPLLLICAVIFLICIVANEMGRYSCNNYSQITGKVVKYANWDVCYVQTPTGFQRWDEYKSRAIASEGLSR